MESIWLCSFVYTHGYGVKYSAESVQYKVYIYIYIIIMHGIE